jgi:hypothetical protein
MCKQNSLGLLNYRLIKVVISTEVCLAKQERQKKILQLQNQLESSRT